MKTKFNKFGTPLIENICEQCKAKHHYITPSQLMTIESQGLQVMCEECAFELGINRKNSSRQDVKIYKMTNKLNK